MYEGTIQDTSYNAIHDDSNYDSPVVDGEGEGYLDMGPEEGNEEEEDEWNIEL